MANDRFHGARTVESTEGARPITPVDTSIIGAVVVAPGAENVAASLTLGTGTSQLTLTAKTAGADGNDITVALVDPDANNATLSVALSGKAITVNLATSAGGAITSTAALIKAALDANAGIAALIDTVSGGTGVVVETAATNLAGGITSANSAQAASVTVGSGTSALTLKAKTAGIAGNQISLRLAHPGAASSALSVGIVGSAITVNLATDSDSLVTSTPALIKTALEGNATIAALVTVTSGGSGTVTPAPTTRLTGGLNEAFPLNTPTVIAGSAAEAARLGTTGTAYAVADILSQIGAVIVVVRVASDADPADQRANVIAGITDLLDAETVTGQVPRILIAPEYSAHKTVADALISAADKLRAIAAADGPNTTDTAAINYAAQFGSDRLVVIDPWIVKDGVDHAPSGVWAGIVAKTDKELGYFWSPSNKIVLGFDGTSRPVAYRLGDSTSAAQLLNNGNVTTIIRQRGTGMLMWGNHTSASDPRFTFISVRRIGDLINDSIARGHQWAVDRNITSTYFEDVTEGVNSYIQTLVNQGAILGGRCWADPDDNTEATVPLGKARFKFEYTPVYPAEDVQFTSIQVTTYISELFPQA